MTVATERVQKLPDCVNSCDLRDRRDPMSTLIWGGCYSASCCFFPFSSLATGWVRPAGLNRILARRGFDRPRAHLLRAIFAQNGWWRQKSAG